MLWGEPCLNGGPRGLQGGPWELGHEGGSQGQGCCADLGWTQGSGDWHGMLGRRARPAFIEGGSLRHGSESTGGFTGQGDSAEEEERVSGMSPNVVTDRCSHLWCGTYRVTVFQSNESNTENLGKGSLLTGRGRRSHLPLLASVYPLEHSLALLPAQVCSGNSWMLRFIQSGFISSRVSSSLFFLSQNSPVPLVVAPEV